MKLLTTIAALLFSFSAFSQDLIEYRDFKFYQNGSEISFEEVKQLTTSYGVAKADFRQGRRDFAASESTMRGIRRNLTLGAVAYSAGVGAIMVVGGGVLNLAGGLGFDPITGNATSTDPDPVYGTILIALGSIPTGIMIHNTSLLATKKKFRKRADKKFHKTAQKLNEAIELDKSQ